MPLDGSVIYPGEYEVEQDDMFGFFCIKGAQGNRDVNLFAEKEELLKCGFFDTWKYYFSYGQSDDGIDVNYVLVDGEWKAYSECWKGNGKSYWEDAVLVAESEHELPFKYGEYKLMEMKENAELFG